ncbi:elongation factor G [Zhengella mangrovi]|uniref:Elongation factor G n=1 Tax=Zhengella mangrovi TaxID=1982044 RepID=A0A2G1QH78_9HYPH|nr:elongation factor G [Zhengella mangrovi]PHP64866.1 elongation factor G [Zhengella mangrovi]
MGERAGSRRKGPKCIAICGPFASGKTTLLESILERTGAIQRAAETGSGHTVSDHSAEAQAHAMSVEAVAATTTFMDEDITFIDCPGSVEFASEAEAVLAGCDAAVVVAEADEKKIPALQLVLKRLDELGVPRILFLNKIDTATMRVRDTVALLQPASNRPLLLRQIPIWKNGIAIGAIDLALERAYVWREHAVSEQTDIPTEEKSREIDARFSMLETLADHDDALMEQLLEEIEPPTDEVFDDLTADLRSGHVVPVLIGSAAHGNGVHRLLKALRHDAPDVSDTCQRLGIEPDGPALAHVMKTVHTPHGGKLSVARILRGTLNDGAEVTASSGRDARVSGIYRMLGKNQGKVSSTALGDTVALGKLEGVATGEALLAGKQAPAALALPGRPQPVHAIAIRARDHKDDVKLSTALAKLAEEDPSLDIAQSPGTGETILGGQGEMHLRVTLERLAGKYQAQVESAEPPVPYQETIRKPVQERGRHKKQSGGHGQFGDVVLEIKPLPRGSGFQFTDTISGGVVPKQYIPSVETGIRDYVTCGPLGLPVVDLAVNLSDGSYHSVDSSDMAFQMAAKLAMREAMPKASPVLLEPVMKVRIFTPSDATAKITAIIPQRRGQILGYDARPDWDGWDVVEATMPQSGLTGLIIELRSLTSGVASYEAEFDHMAELTGRAADEALATIRDRSKAA